MMYVSPCFILLVCFVCLFAFPFYFKDGYGIIAPDYGNGVRGISDSLSYLEIESCIGLERSV